MSVPSAAANEQCNRRNYEAVEGRATSDHQNSSGSEEYFDLPPEVVGGPPPSEHWEPDELPSLDLNYEALKHIASCYLPGDHGECIDVTSLTKGAYHEIKVLHFEDGWTCVGRFKRNHKEHLRVLESESSTAKHVRKYTTIPVPETYFVNFDPSNAVGTQYALIQRMRGVHLHTIWDYLTAEHKQAVLSQIVDVLAQVSSLKFDKIGSLNSSDRLGQMQNNANPEDEMGRGPFDTTEEFLLHCVPKDSPSAPEMESLCSDIQEGLHAFLEDQKDNPVYSPPFRLIHGDFDAQNMLFVWTNESEPPKLSAVIDWDYSFAGPLYYLFEYPIFIQDFDTPGKRQLWPVNKSLRQEFVRELAQKFPKGSMDRKNVRESLRQKTYVMNAFWGVLMSHEWKDIEAEFENVKRYANGIKGIGEGLLPYEGRPHWEPDSELESNDGEDEDQPVQETQVL